MYHSVHDTFYWVEKFADTDFEHHKALGLVWLNVALQLVTTPLVPYNVTDYAIFMEGSASEFAQSYEETLLKQNITLSKFYSSYANQIKLTNVLNRTAQCFS